MKFSIKFENDILWTQFKNKDWVKVIDISPDYADTPMRRESKLMFVLEKVGYIYKMKSGYYTIDDKGVL